MSENQLSPTPRSVRTSSGRISCSVQGTGPVAPFVHGLPLSGHPWRRQPAERGKTNRS